MERKTANVNRDKVYSESLLDVVQNGVLLEETPCAKVMVKNESERDALPASYPPGTIAFIAGGGAAWQKDGDGAWQAIQNPTINVIGDAAITITGHTLAITTPEEA